MVFKDYYKILELKTNKVTTEEIKNAYRNAVKKNHPDLNLDSRLAEEKIKDINEAYKTLSNGTAKRKYDRIWNRNYNYKKQQEYKKSNQKSNSVFGEFSLDMQIALIKKVKNKIISLLKGKTLKQV